MIPSTLKEVNLSSRDEQVQLDASIRKFTATTHIFDRNNNRAYIYRKNLNYAHIIRKGNLFVYDHPSLMDACSTAYIDQKRRIFFNVNFFRRLYAESLEYEKGAYSINPLEFLFRHECQHGMRNHIGKDISVLLNQFNGRQINICGDMVINTTGIAQVAVDRIRRKHFNADFKLTPSNDQNWKKDSNWSIFIDEVQSVIDHAPPSIKAGIGFDLDHFKKYFGMSTVEVARSMQSDWDEARQRGEELAQQASNEVVKISSILSAIILDLKEIKLLILHSNNQAHIDTSITLSSIEKILNHATGITPLNHKELRKNANIYINYSNIYSNYYDEYEQKAKDIANASLGTSSSISLPSNQLLEKMTPNERKSLVLSIFDLFDRNTANQNTKSSQSESSLTINTENLLPPSTFKDQRPPDQVQNAQTSGQPDDDRTQEPASSPPSGQAAGLQDSQNKKDQADSKPSKQGDEHQHGQESHNTVDDSNSVQGAEHSEAKEDTFSHTLTPQEAFDLSQGRQSEFPFDLNRLHDDAMNHDSSQTMDGALEELGLGCDLDADTAKAMDKANSVRDKNASLMAKSQDQELGKRQVTLPGVDIFKGLDKTGSDDTYDGFSVRGIEIGEEDGVLTLEDMFVHTLNKAAHGGSYKVVDKEIPNTSIMDVSGIMIPSRGFTHENQRPAVAYIIDTSGSVSEDLLKIQVAAVRDTALAMQRNKKSPEVYVMAADSEGRGFTKITTWNLNDFMSGVSQIDVSGGGGTDFQQSILNTLDIFGKDGPLEEVKLQGIIYLTDGGDCAPSKQTLDEHARKKEFIELPPIIFAIPIDYWSEYFIESIQGFAQAFYYDPRELIKIGEKASISIEDMKNTIREQRDEAEQNKYRPS